MSTTLYMNGNVKIATNDADFNVKFTKATLDGVDISLDAIATDGKTITYRTNNLSVVGDISNLDFVVTNHSEMYDAEVNVECTVNGTNKDYYRITKEVETLIEGKTTGKGKVEVSLISATTEDVQEGFTCTLKANPKERTSKAELYYAFGDPNTSEDKTTDYKTLGRNVFTSLNNGQRAVCIIKRENLECFNSNNYSEEVEHLNEVFEGNCGVSDTNIICRGNGTFTCIIDTNFIGCEETLGAQCTNENDVVRCN